MNKIQYIVLLLALLIVSACSSDTSDALDTDSSIEVRAEEVDLTEGNQSAQEALATKLDEWQKDCPDESFSGDSLKIRDNNKIYNGPLFDAHLHLVGSKDIKNTYAYDDRLHINKARADAIFDTFEKENVIGVIGFLPLIHEYFVSDDSYNDTYIDETVAVLERPDNKIIPFIYPRSHIGTPPREHGYKLVEFLEKNIKAAGIPFKGIGEIHTSVPQPDSYEGMRLIDQVMLDMYDYAAKNNLVVMIHPELEDMDDLHVALSHNPDTIFLIHGIIDSGGIMKTGAGRESISAGRESISEPLDSLFEKHQNIYFSVDAALMLGYSLMDACMYDKDQFMTTVGSDVLYKRLLSDSVGFWKPVIEGHPAKMMWGTDLAYWWHYDADVIHEIVGFGRDFIAHLDPSVQERFAYLNALDMLNIAEE